MRFFLLKMLLDNPFHEEKDEIASAPIKYLIVSHSSFRDNYTIYCMEEKKRVSC